MLQNQLLRAEIVQLRCEVAISTVPLPRHFVLLSCQLVEVTAHSSKLEQDHKDMRQIKGAIGEVAH